MHGDSLRGAGEQRRHAVLPGFAAVPVGNYQRTKSGRDTPVELELAVPVVLDAVRMAGLPKDEVKGVVVAHPGDHTKQGYFHTFLTSYLGLTSRSCIGALRFARMTVSATTSEFMPGSRSDRSKFGGAAFDYSGAPCIEGFGRQRGVTKDHVGRLLGNHHGGCSRVA